jgi:hypothetical protein
MLRMRTLPAGFIVPCLPTKTDKLPSGDGWLHEIKHDGFRIIARKNGAQVRLYSRPGNDLTRRFPLIVETLARLRSHSCIIDGEAVACDDNGVASFDLIRHDRANERTFLYAFDLIELNGDDLRRDPPVLCNQYFCLRLPKKSHSLLSPIRHTIQSRGHSCTDPRPGHLGSNGVDHVTDLLVIKHEVDELRDLDVIDGDLGLTLTCDDQVLLLGPGVQFQTPSGYAVDVTAS